MATIEEKRLAAKRKLARLKLEQMHSAGPQAEPELTAMQQLFSSEGRMSPTSGMPIQETSPTAEVAATVASSAVADPIAGLGGAVAAALPGEEGQGARTVEDIRNLLTVLPQSPEGREQLIALANQLKPVADVLQSAEQASGDTGFDIAGPVGGALGTALPTALLEAGTFGIGRAVNRAARAADRISDAEVDAALVESAPDIEKLKQESRARFDEVDQDGSLISDNKFLNLALDVEETARKMGSDRQVTPAAQGVVNRFEEELNNSHSISDIETLRRVAKNAASSTNNQEAAIGLAIVDKIDDFVETLTPSQFGGSDNPAKSLKQARDLWGRARRSETIQDAFEDAANQASGLENGLRTQFRAILKNKRKRKFFSAAEKAEMEKVVKGTKAANIAKFLGKFGISEGQATSMLGASLGAGGGATLGSVLGGTAGAGIGAVVVPAIGQVSKGLAQRLTRKNAEFADAVIRAGKNGQKITRAYLKNTPQSKRNPQELTELLVAGEVPETTLNNMVKSTDKLTADSAFFALNLLRSAAEEEDATTN